MPGLDYLCIDAYLNRPGDEGGTVADLVWNGTQDRGGYDEHIHDHQQTQHDA